MSPFDWDNLRLADAVFVHDTTAAVATLALAGTVATVMVRARRSNDVGIRMDGDHLVVWPSTLAVHRRETDDGGGCWRCNHLALG